MQTFLYPAKATWPEMMKRPGADDTEISPVVAGILNQVKSEGDIALKELTRKYDKWDAESLRVPPALLENAGAQVTEAMKEAIHTAAANIEKFHASQRDASTVVETLPGIRCWRKSIAIERVGLYIPGGTAPLISTLLMLGIPARLAGCNKIVVCTPAKEGHLHPALLYAAHMLGIDLLYKVGGAQAIAAMAFGTTEIPAVDKIFGPGNRYVTRAKQLVADAGIAIDMPAGPSEVAIFADESCRPAFVAADLLSQAEHGPDSQVMLVTTSEAVTEMVKGEIEVQKKTLGRLREIDSSLSNSKCIVLENDAICFDFLNAYAPEHLIIASDRAVDLTERVINAGSVFLGHFSPESAGDYVSGTNHTLPTSGFARSYSGVSLDSFVKKVTFQELSAAGLASVKNAIAELADAEGLQAHKNAVLKRFE